MCTNNISVTIIELVVNHKKNQSEEYHYGDNDEVGQGWAKWCFLCEESLTNRKRAD